MYVSGYHSECGKDNEKLDNKFVATGILNMLTQEEKLLSELNERAKFFDDEYRKLRVESIMENNPTKKYVIEQNMKEALSQKEATEEAIKIVSSGLQSQQKTLSPINAIENSETNPSSKKLPDRIEQKEPLNLLQRSIGYIGITVFAGILTVFVIYLLRFHLGIPL